MKTEHLQIRVSAEEKEHLRKAAHDAGTTVSDYVLSKVLPAHRTKFLSLVVEINSEHKRTYALAELSDFFESLSPSELSRAMEEPPSIPSDPVWANYLAAMVETILQRHSLPRPAWLSQIPPLRDPWFATKLKSLRLYLLCVSPPAFRRRNLFVDSTIGDRV